MIELHLNVTGQECLEHFVTPWLKDVVAHQLLSCHILRRRDRQNLQGDWTLIQRVYKLGINEIHRVNPPGDEFANRHIDDRPQIFDARPVAQVREFGGDILAITSEKVASLAADRDHIHRNVMLAHEDNAMPDNVAVQRPGQTLVRGEDHHPDPLDRPLFQKREPAGLNAFSQPGQSGNHQPDAFGVWP